MQIYAYVYLGLILIGLGIDLGQNVSTKSFVYSIIGFAAVLPLVGRALGWW
jgi:sulfite exporter TauE/SafE